MKNNILDNTSLFVLVYRWRKKILLVSFVAGIIAACMTLFINDKYKSEVILFPTMNLSTGKALLNEYNDFLEIGEEQELEHMMQILQSNEIINRVVDRFDLIKHYKIDTSKDGYYIDLMKKYQGNIESTITKFSSIKISVLDEDPQMAADIANEITSLIDTVMNNLQSNMAKQGYLSLIRDRDFVLSEIKELEDSIAKIRALGINDYESQSEVLNEQWARAKIENNNNAANAIQIKLDLLSKFGGQYSALRDDLVHSRGRLNYVQKKLNEHKLTAEESLEHKFIVNSAGPALKKSYPIRWLIVVTASIATAFFMIFVIAFREQINIIKQN